MEITCSISDDRVKEDVDEVGLFINSPYIILIIVIIAIIVATAYRKLRYG